MGEHDNYCSTGFLRSYYYCMFLVLPYVFVLAFPWTRVAFMHTPPAALDIWRYFAAVVIPAAVAGLICCPYLYKMWQLMQQTADRSGGNYEFSTVEAFGLVDTLGSLCFPPVASPEGWYYFSVLGLVLVALVGGILVLGRRAADRMTGRLVWVVLVWIALISYISYAKSSYLFRLFWEVLPGFCQLRVWGRLNIILVPLLALLLARTYDSLEGFLVTAGDIQDKRLSPARLFIVLSGICAVVVGGQMWLAGNYYLQSYWFQYFLCFHGWEFLFFAATVVTCVVLAALLLLGFRGRIGSPGSLWMVLVLLVAVAAADLYPLGSRQWIQLPEPQATVRDPLKVDEMMHRSITTPRVNRYTGICLTPAFNVGYIANWYFDRYVKFHRRVFSDREFGTVVDPRDARWFELLMGMNNGERIFVSRRIDHGTIEDFLRDASASKEELKAELRIESYDGDRLVVEAQLTAPAYLSFIDNWDSDWHVIVNGEPRRIEKLFGTFKSVRLEAGGSSVVFDYRPFGNSL